MDGTQVLYYLRNLLKEGSYSTALDTRTSYDYIYEAVCSFAEATKLLTAAQTITTVATTSKYDLNPDYLCLNTKNEDNEYVQKYYDGSNYYWIPWRDARHIYQANNTSDSSIPTNFSIVDKTTMTDNITSTATSAGASSGGQCTLTDSTAPFANVTAGDIVHNTTDGSDGVVLSITSSSALVTALFGGTNNDWSRSDSYVLVLQPRKQVYLDPPSLTSGHSLYFDYIQRPDPVYSAYGRYRVPDVYMPAIIKFAAWLYRYRDRDPNFGDAWYKAWDMQLRKAKSLEDRAPKGDTFGVNFKKRSNTSRSMR